MWYGMPGYAKATDAPVLLFFRADETVMTLGLTEKVRFLPDPEGPHQLMPCEWFLKEMNPATETMVAGIVKMALR